MQKLPSVVLFIGFIILIASILIGWVIVPKVIDKKISQVSELNLLSSSNCNLEKIARFQFSVWIVKEGGKI